MIRISIFVEGETERKFVKKLIGQRYGYLRIRVTEMIRTGKNTYIANGELRESPGLECSFLLVDVPSREKILSYVRDNAPNMVLRQSFDLLLGLQDLFPVKRGDKMRTMNLINMSLKKSPVYDRISVILAIMETEAWFLCDWRMFERMDTRLTADYIKSHLAIDIANNDPEEAYGHPSKTVDNILKLVHLRYRKHSAEIDRIVGNIDIQYLCSCTSKIDSFFKFVTKLDSCVQPS